jgi:signal transduction histidine kinase
LTVHANGALPPVEGDADALRSALQNIVGNAVKYSPSGGAVEVTATATTASCGFASPIAALGLIPPTCRTSSSRSIAAGRAVDAQVRGSGVGLSVVRHIIASHHATIAVDSRVGEGTGRRSP